jgi:hypothetical protein
MAIIDEQIWMEHLSTETCWELLDTTPVGRVAVTVTREGAEAGKEPRA